MTPPVKSNKLISAKTSNMEGSLTHKKGKNEPNLSAEE